jgi:hypothetical protein
MMDRVSFPLTFLSRPCDREFLMRLKSVESVDDSGFASMLWKLWFWFAGGDGPTHSIGEMSDILMEDSVGWGGPSGGFVELALRSKFMVLTDGEGSGYYSLNGFADLNSGDAALSRKKGGRLRWKKTHELKSRDEASDILGLWVARKDEVIEGESAELNERALMIGLNICRGAGLDLPTEADFRSGYLVKCLAVAKEFDGDALDRIFRFILLNKGDEAKVPRDRNLLVGLDRLRGFALGDL